MIAAASQAHPRCVDAGRAGRSRSPGEYRRIPNWIGAEGCAIEHARFVPCSADRLAQAMDLWERYLHHRELDGLVQLAIVHAEFEAIHPFPDGNGRLGRLLVPLFLCSKELLSSPNFYIGAFLEARRAEYYERLLAISRDGDWSGWCEFFLQAIVAQADENRHRARQIMGLYRVHKDWIAEATHSQYAVRALDWMFARPIFKTSDFIASSGIPKETSKRILRIVRENRACSRSCARLAGGVRQFCVFRNYSTSPKARRYFEGHGFTTNSFVVHEKAFRDPQI
ncbi:MAG: Fic family protein, partial [Hyphomicrobiaceae bacterium]